jgi:hypothetical protein
MKRFFTVALTALVLSVGVGAPMLNAATPTNTKNKKTNKTAKKKVTHKRHASAS